MFCHYPQGRTRRAFGQQDYRNRGSCSEYRNPEWLDTLHRYAVTNAPIEISGQYGLGARLIEVYYNRVELPAELIAWQKGCH
jgi:hypothetical protein